MLDQLPIDCCHYPANQCSYPANLIEMECYQYVSGLTLAVWKNTPGVFFPQPIIIIMVINVFSYAKKPLCGRQFIACKGIFNQPVIEITAHSLHKQNKIAKQNFIYFVAYFQ